MAMKVFPYQDGEVCPEYLKEVTIETLNHPSIIKMKNKTTMQRLKKKQEFILASLILTEFAPNGDVYDLSTNHNAELVNNEKLVRTYFRQLIEGIEYLHNNNLAHLDIKAENLLLDEHFRLKIADFDMVTRLDDVENHGKGTAIYRPPEICDGTVEDLKAVDVYAAGITLFVLRFGNMPYLEDQEYLGYQL
mmetsp:Transcript_25243/g.22247  ORF Transcript_25243/g.22247 Transcript_25243/m.22247 type:complete len:191 (+) Transcript_25243:190-762(+)